MTRQHRTSTSHTRLHRTILAVNNAPGRHHILHNGLTYRRCTIILDTTTVNNTIIGVPILVDVLITVTATRIVIVAALLTERGVTRAPT